MKGDVVVIALLAKYAVSEAFVAWSRPPRPAAHPGSATRSRCPYRLASALLAERREFAVEKQPAASEEALRLRQRLTDLCLEIARGNASQEQRRHIEKAAKVSTRPWRVSSLCHARHAPSGVQNASLADLRRDGTVTYCWTLFCCASRCLQHTALPDQRS